MGNFIMDNFIITNVNIRLKDTNGMKAICSIVINDMFVVHDIRVIENRSGKLIVAMPSKKMPDGRFRDVCNPSKAEARRIIDEAVLAEYKKATTLSDEILSLIL